MADLTALLMAVLSLGTLLLVISKAKNHLQTRFMIWQAKKRKKPIKLVHIYGSDKTMKETTAIPDTKDKTIEIDGVKYNYNAQNVLYSPEYNIQGVVIREGGESIVDTQTWQVGELDPRMITSMIILAEERGRVGAIQLYESYKKYLLVIIALAAIAIILTFITMQNTSVLIEQASRLLTRSFPINQIL